MAYNQTKILEILDDWNFWGKTIDTGIEREEYLLRMEKFSKTGQIISLVGVRRSGKSTLMLQYIKRLIKKGVDPKNTLYINFEDPRFSGELSLNFLQSIYETYQEYFNSKTPYLFLDEVQNISGWERFVRALHERKVAKIFVSGSTSKLLSLELGSVLTGRHLRTVIYPLSFEEFLYFKKIRIKEPLNLIRKRSIIRRFLREYLEFGAFPQVVLTEENRVKQKVLFDYFEDIIGRDVIERYKIKKSEELRSLAMYYFTNIGSSISFNRIKKFLGLSFHTLERFSYNLSYPYLIFFVKKFAYSLKEQQVNPRKVYAIDTGLRNAISFRFSEDLGKIYENVVFLELLRRGREIYYWKGKRECDFLIRDGSKEEAIQVCADIKNPEVRERELNGLLEAMNRFNLKEGLIITDDYEGEEVVQNRRIEFQPLWRWLLK